MRIKVAASVMLVSLICCVCATARSAVPPDSPAPKLPIGPVSKPAELVEDGKAAEEAGRFFPEGTKHDFGPVPKGTQAVHLFRLVNLSNAPLKVESIRTNMAPLAVALNNYELQPNQEENLIVSMDTRRFNGARSNYICVRMSCNGKPMETMLNVAADSRADLDLLPLEFGAIQRGVVASAQTDLIFLGHPKLRVTAATCESNFVHVEFKELVRNEVKTVYQIQATTRSGIPEGKWFTDVQLMTNNPIMPKIVVPVNVEVKPSFEK